MEEALKRCFKQNCKVSIVESLIVAILGVILIITKEEMVKIISAILGIIFIFVGMYKIINYLLTKTQGDFYDFDFIYGICACIMGVIAFVFRPELVILLRIIIALWILYTSFVRMTLSIKLQTLNMTAWTYSLFFSILMFAFGLYVLINQGVLATVIGVIMVVFSIIDIIEDLIFMNNI